ncbi:MAG: carboxy-S-adenosyl-L-methionine synthase CmoA [Gammaproteobacteria bacterium]|nr:carboxy-S-adenosyl-L-methionine synthase CmoA [Gammaproteobacteria bacterium]
MAKDSIYSQPLPEVTAFAFDDKVAAVFSDMIRRSVPGYSTVIAMTGVLAERYATPHSHIYDLGCSLGAAVLAMRHRIHAPDCKIIAVDNSEAMIQRCRENLAVEDSTVAVDILCADLRDLNIENASVVVMNFTLQFIPKDQRDAIIRKIYQGMKPGGAFILSEKLHFDDADADRLLIELHHEFKRANGYSDLEISQKRSAIENVLVPETLQTHLQRLKNAGFAQSELWFQCFNFASVIAIKQ